jgi:antitoxin component HigA of HigAB toxin-antitoxin module
MGERLAEALPAVIETEAENRCMIAIADRLMDKPDRTPEGILADLMAERGLKQADLLPIFGSRSVVSEVLSGKRGITKKQVKALAAFFLVSPELFI